MNNPKSPQILIYGSSTQSTGAIRATLEIQGYTVSQATSESSFDNLVCNSSFDFFFLSSDEVKNCNQKTFETIALTQPKSIVLGYSTSPNPKTIVDFIRNGGIDFFFIPSELNMIAERIGALYIRQQETLSAEEDVVEAVKLCNQLHEERAIIEEENDSLNNQLANIYCETEKKIQQTAISSEFQTLVSQELDVESMLRTALGYMLTKIGALNAVVYLKEGATDWGVGAFINYDRQAEQFQSLIDEIGPAICSSQSQNQKTQHYKNGEKFANNMGLDPVDFSGSEVVTFGCFSNDQCMAVVSLFRDESRPFCQEAIENLETIKTIFGGQLGTILKIHNRAESAWPSESIDDDDWSIDKAA